MTAMTVVTVGYPKKCNLNVKCSNLNKCINYKICTMYTETPRKRVLTQS